MVVGQSIRVHVYDAIVIRQVEDGKLVIDVQVEAVCFFGFDGLVGVKVNSKISRLVEEEGDMAIIIVCVGLRVGLPISCALCYVSPLAYDLEIMPIGRECEGKLGLCTEMSQALEHDEGIAEVYA